MKRTLSIICSVVVLALLLAGLSAPALVKAAAIPTISIVKVDAGKTVTIQTHNFPANDSFDVLMNTFGTRGVGGVKVETVSSGSGGSMSFTFNIPASLANEKTIAIRLESPKSGYYSYNWFYNQTAGGGTTPPAVTPTISIESVDIGKTVTIKTHNFPANDTFDVLMGKMGTKGVGGTKVDTIETGTGESKTYTFNIPDGLKGDKQVAIRLQSSKSGYFSYNWFWNVTSGGGGTPPGVIPTFSIVSVEAGKTVKIETKNFPANDTFDVLMGKMGTKGVGGTKVETIDSGAGGTLTFTFNIPDSLKNDKQIAIRLQSTKSGYFSYNWFWNNTSSGDGGGTVPPGKVPVITITKVVRDASVTIETKDFPANDTFDVYMGKMGTKGVGGVKVDTVTTGEGGKLTFTFTIPDSLKGNAQIAIRLQSSKSGYFSFNWFWNNTYP